MQKLHWPEHCVFKFKSTQVRGAGTREERQRGAGRRMLPRSSLSLCDVPSLLTPPPPRL